MGGWRICGRDAATKDGLLRQHTKGFGLSRGIRPVQLTVSMIARVTVLSTLVTCRNESKGTLITG